jgi:hypothetical protein
MKSLLKYVLIIALFSAQVCFAVEELITSAHYSNGEQIPYILNYQTQDPKYVIILFPGGTGRVDPHMEDGILRYSAKNNFLVRSREFIVDDEFATVTTNSSSSEERMQGILDDLKSRFPHAQIYLMGTSNGTFSTTALADYLSDKIAGEIHTSSLSSRIYYFDAHKYKNRQLIVHHKNDECRKTPFSAAEHSHLKYGNDFIAVEGGTSVGDPCEAFAYHGYDGIENETIQAIKNWIKQGGQSPQATAQ